MNIYIVRHATAEPRGPGVAETDRQLTGAGKQELKAVLRCAKAAGVSPELILTSPWARAFDTAARAAKAFGTVEPVPTEALLPDVPPPQAWKEIQKHHGVRELMIVGHEPQLGRLAAFLLEAPLSMDFKKAGILRIAVQDRPGKPRGILKWMLTPKLAGKS